MRQIPGGAVAVRVRSEVGGAVALWCGDPTDVGREHHVEWTVDDDVTWGGNTLPAAVPSPALSEDGGQVVFRGRLALPGDGGAVLEVGDAQILFDVAGPPPPVAADGGWVEIRVERDSVSLYPYAP
ncbi:hypothetical protein [Streptomyces sp. NBC_00102]|uniref:hypothetical protein n=1 Tax=Streptomyces sp. NBC_00102 TaxID=2975652 RepID=UPI0022593A77|nr:hypothetical protein [Streptomyces sp. NBC_00102]MCX5395998.1 hypothetical protein [Streptomyces sp. NBC_00102]